MFRATTLIELLTTITILIISIYFITPTILSIKDSFLLQREIDNVIAFIYQVETNARYSKKRYTITIDQNKKNNKWCIVAIANSPSIPCPCLNIKSCQIKTDYFLYENTFPNSVVKNSRLYPKIFSHLDGRVGRLSENCLNISIGKESKTLRFNALSGVINVSEKKTSRCDS